MLVGCGFNQHLPPQIRAGFAALARHLYLDVYPQLPNCGVFVCERESETERACSCSGQALFFSLVCSPYDCFVCACPQAGPRCPSSSGCTRCGARRTRTPACCPASAATSASPTRARTRLFSCRGPTRALETPTPW
jgi:hypothetical protein